MKLLYDMVIQDQAHIIGSIEKIDGFISLVERDIRLVERDCTVLNKDKDYIIKITDNNRLRIYEEERENE